MVGIPVQFETQSVQLEIRSPNRKFERYDRIAFELAAGEDCFDFVDRLRTVVRSSHLGT